MFWNKLMKVYGRVTQNNYVVLSMFGLAFSYSHVDLLYQLINTRYYSALFFSDLVSVPAFITGALLAWKLKLLHRRGVFLVGAPILAMVGIAALKFSQPALVGLAGAAMAAVGFTFIFLLWLEVYGCFSPLRAAIALAGSSLLHVVIFFLLREMREVSAFVITAILPLVSVLFLVVASRSVDDTGIPRKEPERLAASFGILAVWVLFFGVATGFGRDVTGVAAGASISMLGRSVPALIVFFGILLLSNRFDFKVIYLTVSPLMAIGIVSMFFAGEHPYLGQFFVNAGAEGCAILMAIIACGAAYMTRTTAVFGSGLLFGIECLGFVAGSQLAKQFYYAKPHYPSADYAVGTLMVIAVVATTFFVFRTREVLASRYNVGRILNLGQDELEDSESFVSRTADEYGLSPTERIVLVMLAEGVSRKTISEELFIAPVTVRVHINHISRKMNLASSTELENVLSRRRAN